MTTRGEHRARLIEFLRTIQRPDRPVDRVEDDQELLQHGLADSLALLEIVTYLETNYGVDFVAQGLLPTDLSTVRAILDIIEKTRPPETGPV
ncbi:MAG: phosphopantetheine-binding protein [Acidobacteriota bacterium]|jgi:acyl carrier protein